VPDDPRKSLALEDGAYHDQPDVREAILALSDPDLLRLRGFARWRLNGLQTPSVDCEDLVNEAIARTMQGDRKWRVGTNFVVHLLAVIRSITDYRRKSLEIGVTETELESVASAPQYKFEHDLEVRSEFTRLRKLTGKDPTLLRILDLRAEGASVAEVTEELGITQKQYESLMSQIRRAVRVRSKRSGVGRHAR
jgi:DNA-directed RNA polymerase specialized sigma24 family protein